MAQTETTTLVIHAKSSLYSQRRHSN